MLVISDEEASRLATPELVTDAVKQALVAAADGSGEINPVVIGRGFEPGHTYSIKSGSASGAGLLGLKVGSYWPRNDAVGLPRHGSTILLIDSSTGHISAAIGARLTNGPRTAAADALATSALARPDASTLAVIGTGAQAAYEIAALARAVRPGEVLVASRDPGKARRFCAQVEERHGIAARPAGVEEACRSADIVVTATPARAPLFEAEWIRPGTHVSSMGSDQAGKQELPPGLLRRAKLFCDLPDQAFAIGELQHARDAVAAGEAAVTAIGDVLSGRAVGRESNDEITVFDSSGLALQDLFVGAALVEAALAGIERSAS